MIMEGSNLNKSMCEEIFGGEIDVTYKYRDWLHERNGRELEILKKVEVALEKMDSFARIKKNMNLPIRDSIQLQNTFLPRFWVRCSRL